MAADVDGGDGGSISGINVTPLVDVMLVLLVIFMVTAPMIQQGVEVDLPVAGSEPLSDEESTPMVVSVTHEGGLFLNDDATEIDALAALTAALLEERPDLVVYVRGDRRAPYGEVAAVVAALKTAGVTQVGLITDTGAN